MEAGPSSSKERRRPAPWPPGIEPFVSKSDHNPRELKSWANRTGFNHNFSGESTLSSIRDEGGKDADPPSLPPPPPPLPPLGRGVGSDLEKGPGRRIGNGAASNVELEPILGPRKGGADINPVADLDSELVALKGVGRIFEKEKRRIGVEPEVDLKEEGRRVGNDLSVRGKGDGINGMERRNEEPSTAMGSGDGEPKKDEVEIDFLVDSPDQQITPFKSGLMCDLMENPGYG